MIRQEICLIGRRSLKILENNFYLIKENQTIKQFIEIFEKEIRSKNIDTAIKLNKDKTVKGIITSGDLRRLIEKKNNLNLEISNFLNINPISIFESDLDNNLNSKIEKLKIKRSKNLIISKILVLDKNRKFKYILDVKELYTNHKYKNTCIIGLGHIGIPLAVHFLKKFDKIYGVDNNKTKIKNLKKFKIDFYEKNLYDDLLLNIKQKKFILSYELKKCRAENYIICLGTHFHNKNVNNKAIIKIANELGKILKKGDLVILRGTVQVGTTREILLRNFENQSSLKCGKDFYLSYMPERLIEGNALEEMENIPTLISAFSEKCLEKTINFAKLHFKNYLSLKSFEEAEIIKLASNTYRDFKFAFANEVTRIANQNNLSGKELIQKANFGYERNDIPSPSIGVGGFCLPKDPYLFNKSLNSKGNFTLNFNSREINKNSMKINFVKIKNILKHKSYSKKKEVLICGVAFKGYPETLDTRNSPALLLGNYLKKHKFKITFIDPLAKMFQKKKLLKHLIIKESINNLNLFDGIIIVNNHEFFLKTISKNLKFNKGKFDKMIFDTWSILNKNFIKKLNWKYFNL